jgi:hypothetical protein
MPGDLFRAELGEPHHFAYVVDDIAATVDRLAATLGTGPFFLFEGVPLENVRSGDEPAEFAHNSAFGSCDGTVIELIEPIRLAPARVEQGFAAPRPRIHHIAYVVSPAAVAALRSSLDQRGLPQYLSSQLGEIDASVHDATAVLGHDLEIHADCQPLRDSFAMVVDAAAGWDGAGPLRPFPS